MLTASRALGLSANSAPELPRVDWLRDLYALGGGSGVRPRQGETIMIAGRSGTQKSGLALAWVASMNIPTLYMSGDMSAFQASCRLAGHVLGETTEQVVEGMKGPGRGRYLEALEFLQIRFSFGKPITWKSLEQEFDAEVELYNRYPRIVVVDNLMDVQGATSDYTAQMDALQTISDMTRDTGSTAMVLHHASDKTWDAQTAPWKPPSRDQVKGGLSEKPELALTVALDPTTLTYRIACVKQRMGPCDPSATTYATLKADPERTRFHPYH